MGVDTCDEEHLFVLESRDAAVPVERVAAEFGLVQVRAPCATCHVHHGTCHVQHATCHRQHATCNVQRATCRVLLIAITVLLIAITVLLIAIRHAHPRLRKGHALAPAPPQLCDRRRYGSDWRVSLIGGDGRLCSTTTTSRAARAQGTRLLQAMHM